LKSKIRTDLWAENLSRVSSKLFGIQAREVNNHQIVSHRSTLVYGPLENRLQAVYLDLIVFNEK